MYTYIPTLMDKVTDSAFSNAIKLMFYSVSYSLYLSHGLYSGRAGKGSFVILH